MAVTIRSPQFKQNATAAIHDVKLQGSRKHIEKGFIGKRAKAVDKMLDFEALRDEGKAIKDHVLQNLDIYLEKFEANVKAAGGHVHWAATAEDARTIIADICHKAEAKSVTKGKSMISEEINLNDHLEKQGFEVVETDLGEYIIQLRGEHPSHIIAPAVHVSQADVEAIFREKHTFLDADRKFEKPEDLLNEARGVLRAKFQAADVGITGANFLIAESGTALIVTNEGNGDLTQILPRVHVAVTSIEKIVPTFDDASVLLRLLTRSATGQEATVYTTFFTGNKRHGDPDGPEEFHIVLLDNGRSNMLGSEFEEMLRCIRCGACMNHCPVYHAVGGHAYGWVYPGPMGAVLTPSLIGVDKAGHLPNASTFCGRCESVCPVKIPLPKLMRNWRVREFERHLTPAAQRYGIMVWAFFARRPSLYLPATKLAMKAMKLMARGKPVLKSLPLGTGWTAHRDFPTPQGETFQAQWKKQQANKERSQ
jgi:L-lactate dehydrogenase complex protein LldF